MIAQLTFDEAVDRKDRKPATIQERFDAWHKANPKVYAKLVELTRELHQKGFKTVGISLVFEVTRWHYMMEIGPLNDCGEGFTLNNVFRSRYARLIMRTEADLKNIYEIRELQSE